MFTLALDATGNYTFTLDKPLDHAAAGADAIALNFGVTVTDKDGDAAMGTITVNIVDDVPVAHDDVNGFTTHVGNTVIGNVITGANEQAGGADTLSKDAPDTVTQVGFSNGAGPGIVAAMTNGSATINDANGVLTINADGSYSYKVTHTGGSDSFVYTLQDSRLETPARRR